MNVTKQKYYELIVMEKKKKNKQEEVDGLLPFEDFSPTFNETYSGLYGCIVKEYADSMNNNIIVEGSFTRLLNQMDSKDFAIISAYRNEKTKKENILRNRKLRGILNDKKMGVHQLVGHWQEAPEGVDYKDAKKSELTDVVERSYFIARPADMSYSEFKHTIIDLLTIDGLTQDCGIIHKNGGDYNVIYPSGTVEKIGSNVTVDKVAQAYSQYVKKTDRPFVFEGVEFPSSVSGMRMFEEHGLEYPHILFNRNFPLNN